MFESSTAPARSCSAAATSCCRCCTRASSTGLGDRGPVPRRLRRGAGRARARCSRSRRISAPCRAAAEWLGRRGGRARRDLPAVVPARVRGAAVLGPAPRVGGVPARARRDERRRRRAAGCGALPADLDGRRERARWTSSWRCGPGRAAHGRVPPIIVVALAAAVGQIVGVRRSVDPVGFRSGRRSRARPPWPALEVTWIRRSSARTKPTNPALRRAVPIRRRRGRPGGAVSMLEVTIPPKTLIKPHTHTREDEFSLVWPGPSACARAIDDRGRSRRAAGWPSRVRSPTPCGTWPMSRPGSSRWSPGRPGALFRTDRAGPHGTRSGVDAAIQGARRGVRADDPRRLDGRAQGEVRDHVVAKGASVAVGRFLGLGRRGGTGPRDVGLATDHLGTGRHVEV